MKIPIPNALTIHTIGLGGSPFPISVWIRPGTHGVALLECFPIRLADIAGPVARAMAGHFALFTDLNVQPVIFPEVEDPLGVLLAEEGVDPVYRDESGFIVPSEEVEVVLATLPTYHLTMIDLDEFPSQERRKSIQHELKEHWRASRRANDLGEAPVLFTNRSRARSILLSSQDDCFLNIESTSPEMIEEIAIALITMAAGTFLHKHDSNIDSIEPVPVGLVRQIGGEGRGVCFRQQRMRLFSDSKGLLPDGTLAMPFEAKALTSFGEREGEAVGLLCLDTPDDAWYVRPFSVAERW